MVNTVKIFLNMLNNLQQMRLKLLQKEQFKKSAESTGDLIGNNISNKITKVQKNSQRNNSETVTIEHDQEIRKEREIYLQKKDKKLLMN